MKRKPHPIQNWLKFRRENPTDAEAFGVGRSGKRPKRLTKKHLWFLNSTEKYLREGSSCRSQNMYDHASWLMESFYPLGRADASQILGYWFHLKRTRALEILRRGDLKLAPEAVEWAAKSLADDYRHILKMKEDAERIRREEEILEQGVSTSGVPLRS